MTSRGAVLIPGGTGALGRAIAAEVIAHGWRAVLTGRRPADDPQVAEIVAGLGPQASYAVCDVTDRERVIEVCAEVDDLAALVYAAGVTHPGPVREARTEHVRETLATNVEGAMFVMTAAAEVMMSARRGGAIVSIGSWTQDVPDPNDVVYGASKAALKALTSGLAFCLGPYGVRANTLVVGIVGDEGMAARHMESDPGYARRAESAVPLRRFATAAEIARIARWLISDESAYIHGTEIRADGGASLRLTGPVPV